MNLQHLKYAVAIEECGSISKASEALYVAQPNLSRAIRELEQELKIVIFQRTSKGMVPTPQGKVFLQQAHSVLDQMEQLKTICYNAPQQAENFSISVPRASYIADAFAQFTSSAKAPVELLYKETNSMEAIQNICQHSYQLGVVRYAEEFDGFFQMLFSQNELESRCIARFCYCLVFSEKSKLAEKQAVSSEDLLPLLEITHADPYIPPAPFGEPPTAGQSQKVSIFERGSQFDVLCANPNSFMWVSPIPESVLRRNRLIQRPSAEGQKVYRDVLLWKRGQSLNNLCSVFIAMLEKNAETMMASEPYKK